MQTATVEIPILLMAGKEEGQAETAMDSRR